MAYMSNYELPSLIKMGLPDNAQSIYRATFNGISSAYHIGQEAGYTRKAKIQLAHKIAWNAVKEKYKRQGIYWVEK